MTVAAEAPPGIRLDGDDHRRSPDALERFAPARRDGNQAGLRAGRELETRCVTAVPAANDRQAEQRHDRQQRDVRDRADARRRTECRFGSAVSSPQTACPMIGGGAVTPSSVGKTSLMNDAVSNRPRHAGNHRWMRTNASRSGSATTCAVAAISSRRVRHRSRASSRTARCAASVRSARRSKRPRCSSVAESRALSVSMISAIARSRREASSRNGLQGGFEIGQSLSVARGKAGCELRYDRIDRVGEGIRVQMGRDEGTKERVPHRLPRAVTECEVDPPHVAAPALACLEDRHRRPPIQPVVAFRSREQSELLDARRFGRCDETKRQQRWLSAKPLEGIRDPIASSGEPCCKRGFSRTRRPGGARRARGGSDRCARRVRSVVRDAAASRATRG